jgi:very-short-patch-repair endonuclease
MSFGGDIPRVRLAGFNTTAELLARGVSRDRIREMLKKGDLVQIQRGSYVSAHLWGRLQLLSERTLIVRAMGALSTLSAAGSVISHQSAAQLHGLDLLLPPGQVSITRPPGAGSRSGRRGVHVHWARLPAGHAANRFAVPVTSVARTVIDLGRSSDFREALVAADSALHQHLTSKKELRAVLAECRGMPGLLRAIEIVEFADGLAESPLESIARVGFRTARLPAPELQVVVRNEGFVGRVDFLWKRFRTVVEVDGAIKYADPSRAKAQLRRDRRLREAGYEVLHFDWRDVTTDPAGVAAAIRAAFRRGLAAGNSAGQRGPAA